MHADAADTTNRKQHGGYWRRLLAQRQVHADNDSKMHRIYTQLKGHRKQYRDNHDDGSGGLKEHARDQKYGVNKQQETKGSIGYAAHGFDHLLGYLLVSQYLA